MDGTIRLVSMETEAVAGFRLLEGWGRATGLAQPKSQMTEFILDIEARTVSRAALTEGAPIEFPAIDNRAARPEHGHDLRAADVRCAR